MLLKSVLSVAASVCAGFLLFVSASATPIAAGQTVTATMVQPGSITVLATFSNVAFTSQAPSGQASTFSGVYSASVFRDTNNNLCQVAGQCLTFGIQVTNNSSSTDGIETVTTGPFSNLFTYNVGYNNANGGVAPLYIADSAQNSAMSFNFTSIANTSNILKPGQASDYLLIQSSATSYTFGNISFQDNQTATVGGFIPAASAVVIPTAATPEPSSFALLGTGMLGVAGVIRRRLA